MQHQERYGEILEQIKLLSNNNNKLMYAAFNSIEIWGIWIHFTANKTVIEQQQVDVCSLPFRRDIGNIDGFYSI